MSDNDSSHSPKDDESKEGFLFGFIIFGALLVVLAIVAFVIWISWRAKSRERQSRAAALQQKKEEKVKKIQSSLVSKVWSTPIALKDDDAPSSDLEAQRETISCHGENVDANVLSCDDISDEEDYNNNLQHQHLEAVCPICLGPYHDGELVVQSCNSACQHIFHRECIAEWLAKKDECPCCRQIFLAMETSSI